MRCAKCGTENPPGRVLCVRCGSRLRGSAATVAGPSPGSPEADAVLMQRLRGDLRRLLAVAVVVAAVAVALGLFLR